MNIPTHDLGQGQTALLNLLRDMGGQDLDLNEADTRHQFIDRLIHECLGWDRVSATKLERRFNGDYSDYELGVGAPVVVIEAKRAGKTFEVPVEASTSILRSLRSLSISSTDFKAALDQCLKYCGERGIQIGAIANSSQIVVFLGVRSDGIPPTEGKCLVFNGYEQLKNNFARLWQALSPGATGQKLLLDELSTVSVAGVPSKLSSYLSGYPSFRYPSDYQQSLRTLSDLLIEDAPNTPALRRKFLEDCYCENGALAKEALVGKNILSARYAAMFSPSQEGPTLQSLKSAPNDQYGLSSEVIAEALGKRPIVIIGDVGVGKTSFIRHLIFVRAADEVKNSIFLYLDLGSQASLGQNIHEFFLSEIERQLLEDHQVDLYEDHFVRGVYHGDLQRFERGIYGRLKDSAPDKFIERQIEHLQSLIGNRINHLQKSINHLSKGRRKQVIICIDNADQRDGKTQQDAFLSAQEFAANWHALVLISIRPKTYFTSKASGSVSAYPQRVLTISPPRIDLVLKKRLEFSLELAEGRVPIEQLNGITFKLEAIALFIKALISSLRYNKDLTELLVNLTGGNIREALELIKGFIGSPNIDSQKIIEIMEKDEDERYVIPLHEFSKQALLGNYAHYEPRSSLAFNLFDAKYPNKKEHFLCAFVVAFLLADSSARSPEGFVATSDTVEEMQKFGFVPDQIESALRRLTNKKMIETTERVTFDEGLRGLVGDMPLAFRSTTIGAYHIQRWIGTFSYVDAMICDTPIFDDKLRIATTAKIASFDIKDRYRRTIDFRNYLDAAWDEFGTNTPNYFDWPTLESAAQSTFDNVKRHIDRLQHERMR